ncbi:copper-containing nitrite reductase [Marinobacter pelagius]|uniref:copper-containing nitrite reductase n=1 Tax=Marinobacter sp. C7 TaxID=2951363 RepID=UPI001EEF9CAC|nr:copper-containing nitrite reductase [Marinobacter sp. C7]MCG7200276.1 copper-containing nitrite reductase [Marinobacter sp. C7]
MSEYPVINTDRRRFFKGAAAIAGTVAAGSVAASNAHANKIMNAPLGETADTNALLAYSADQLEVFEQQLVAPPFLPTHSQSAAGKPVVVKVTLEIIEKEVEVEPGVKMWAMTFNGSIPAPMIVCHQYDFVEVTVVNPGTNSMAHNIDLHSATGALGGAGLTLVNPGEKVTLRFRAIKSGVFVYHCAPGEAMIPWHVVSGMNGAMLVLPREGLKDGAGNPVRYDRAYYIGEQDLYLPRDESGKYKRFNSPMEGFADTIRVMEGLIPTHTVFNGAKGALTGESALTAKVGETVLFIHSQANRDTRPHLIGGHGDHVWERGSFDTAPLTNLETWFVAGGSAGAATYTFRQPGIYAYVNHNLIEAVSLGAAAHVKVEGDWDENLMTQVSAPSPI